MKTQWDDLIETIFSKFYSHFQIKQILRCERALNVILKDLILKEKKRHF